MASAPVCDLCGATPTKRWVVTSPAHRTVSSDLCDEHAEPLVAIMDLLPRGKRGQVHPRPVVTERAIRARRKQFRGK